MSNPVMKFFNDLFIVRPTQGKTAAQLADSLEAHGKRIYQKYSGAPRTQGNHNAISHIIGIERWSLNRLRTLVEGKPLVQDEYDAYRPTADTPWPDLIEQFRKTREETVALARGLTPAQLGQTVEHNEFGEMVARGWLGYMDAHATRESFRVR